MNLPAPDPTPSPTPAKTPEPFSPGIERNVRWWDLLQVFLRSFLIQAPWNFQCGLNYGFAYALSPILRRLYLKEERPACFQRHLEYFNTQPYMASFILGAVAKMELEKSKAPSGEWQRKSDEIKALKMGMMGPVAAIGDSLFWASFRPFCGLLTVGLVFTGIFPAGRWAAITAVIFFLILYNAGHLGVRLLAFLQGWSRGDQVMLILQKYGFQEAMKGLRASAAIILGILLVLLNQPAADYWVGFFLMKMSFFAALIFFYSFLLRKKVGASQLFYGIVLFALMLAYWPKFCTEPGITEGFCPFVSNEP